MNKYQSRKLESAGPYTIPRGSSPKWPQKSLNQYLVKRRPVVATPQAHIIDAKISQVKSKAVPCRIPPCLGEASLCSVKAINWSDEAHWYHEDNLLYSKSTDSNVYPIPKNTFTETSRIMFDQTSGTVAQPSRHRKLTVKTSKPQVPFTHTFARGKKVEGFRRHNACAIYLPPVSSSSWWSKDIPFLINSFTNEGVCFSCDKLENSPLFLLPAMTA